MKEYFNEDYGGSMYNIFIINPGSTSDELSYFRGDEEIFHEVSRYSPSQLQPYEKKPVTSQLDFRFDLIKESIEKHKIDIAEIDCAIGRGGLLKSIPSGTFIVDKIMLKDLAEGKRGDHPSNLGGILAKKVTDEIEKVTLEKKPAFIADSVVVDEMWKWARYSGIPENPRISIFHALNQKRVARLAAEEMGRKYEDLSMIIIHGGGGISIGLHHKGKVIDVNNALDGEGPFTPQRSGGVPAGGLVKMCFSGDFTLEDIKLKIKGRGGLVPYLGTSDLIIIEDFIDGKQLTEEQRSEIKASINRDKALEILQAMAYQMAKEVGSLAAALGRKPDAIVFSGGVAYCNHVVNFIKEKIEWIAPFKLYPGGDEMMALKEAAQRVLSGEEKAKTYGDYI